MATIVQYFKALFDTHFPVQIECFKLEATVSHTT